VSCVTGVQTCALPIFRESVAERVFYPGEILTISYTVNVTHTFPDKKSKKA